MPTEKDLSGFYKVKTGVVLGNDRLKPGEVEFFSHNDAKALLDAKAAEPCEEPTRAEAKTLGGTYITKTSVILRGERVGRGVEVRLSHDDAALALASGAVEPVAKAVEPTEPVKTPEPKTPEPVKTVAEVKAPETPTTQTAPPSDGKGKGGK